MRGRLPILAFAVVLCVVGTVPQARATANTWSTAGSMATARFGHTATLLPDGRVLVAGGSGAIPSAELYDPAMNTWSSTGSLAAGRVSDTATLLPNGKVLIAGGFNSSLGTLATAEFYDPAAKTWSPAGTMATARRGHTATLLANGKVLVAGGQDSSYAWLASAELYDPIANSWSPASTMAFARGIHEATLLANGNVLVTGGWSDASGYLASAEIYDAAANAWVAAGSLTNARAYHTATLLPNGKVLVAGGVGQSYLASAELYDPATNTWSPAANMASVRWMHTATLLTNGRLLVAGGWSASAEVYDPAANAWSPAGVMATDRHLHTATLLSNGKVLVAAGENSSGALASAELYDPGNAIPAWVVSPIIGNTQTRSVLGVLGGCSGLPRWCFEQHPGIGLHTVNGGMCDSDDTWAWDSHPFPDPTETIPVYAVAPGKIVAYAGSGCSSSAWGAVLVEHGSGSNVWWSGYLHMAAIPRFTIGEAVDANTRLGNISNVGTTDFHLHFVVYAGANAVGALRSLNVGIFPRLIQSSLTAPAPSGSSEIDLPPIFDPLIVRVRPGPTPLPWAS